jgi:hypothetical protein
LQQGADPFKCHEHVGLRAGHFLCYHGIDPIGAYHPFFRLVREDCFRFRKDEKRLLEAAFDTSTDIESCCRCSPEGFTPITTLFKFIGQGRTWDVKESFQRMIRNVDFSPADMKKHWRAFVIGETFNRLEMTLLASKCSP